jgi:hypothetical protein
MRIRSNSETFRRCRSADKLGVTRARDKMKLLDFRFVNLFLHAPCETLGQ